MSAEEETPLAGRDAPAAGRVRKPIIPAGSTGQRRRRFVTPLILAGATILGVNAIVGEKGYLATVRADRDAQALAEQLQKVEEQNQQLQDLIDRLQNDPATLEEMARRDLRLIKPGEKLVIIRDAKPASTPPPAAPAR
jgi:cell division protein FtsB